jgi:hypothetical protein
MGRANKKLCRIADERNREQINNYWRQDNEILVFFAWR